MRELNRLFFALWPDEPTRMAAQDAAKTLKLKMQPGGYLSKPDRYHLTLQFLGDFVPAESEAAAQQAASLIRSAPFTLTLDHAGSFRNPKIPWWLAPRVSPPGLTRLYQRLHDKLLEVRVLPERMKFVPHLTVLRDAGQVLPQTAIQPIEWQVQEFVLLRSRLDLKPMHYDILGRWPLTGSEDSERAHTAQMPLF